MTSWSFQVTGIRGYRSKRSARLESHSQQQAQVAPARQVRFKTLPIMDPPSASRQADTSRHRLNPVAEVSGSGVLFLDPEASHTPLRLISDTVSLYIGLVLGRNEFSASHHALHLQLRLLI